MPIGTAMGTFGISKLQKSCSDDYPLFQEDGWRMTGYPFDKPLGTMWDTGPCEQWLYTCQWFYPKIIRFNCDVTHGMSGSGIRTQNDQIIGVAVAAHTPWSYGVAIDDEHLKNISWLMEMGTSSDGAWRAWSP